jgi:multiple sugar transport system ATP-binding protein
MAEVRFEQVDKSYGGKVNVIHDLNLHIRDHEFLVLVGPSGCGKSTILRMIAGLEEITAGDLYIGERRVNDMPPKDRDIAMVFQNYALYPHMSVYENMAFSLKLRHIKNEEIQRRVRRAAGLLGIADYLQRKPRELSGGQRQRVALGRALVREPQVFLLDEPLSNLDAKLRVQTRAEISRLHQQTGTTFVYVTHDQVEAMTMGDRIAVLNAGVIQQLGTPEELYNQPANLFVAGFIGSPSMNLFSARLQRDSGGSEGAQLVIGAGGEERTLHLTGAAAEQIAGQATSDGRAVIVGVRPENLRVVAEGAENAFGGTVEVVEHLGNEQLVYLRLPGLASAPVGAEAESGGMGTARVAAGVAITPGSRLTLQPELSHLLFFDPVTSQRFL